MTRIRQSCPRISIKCAFTIILVFVIFTFVLTFAIYGRPTNHVISSVKQVRGRNMEQKVWRGVGVKRSEDTLIEGGRENLIKYQKNPDNIFGKSTEKEGGAREERHGGGGRISMEINEEDEVMLNEADRSEQAAMQVVKLLRIDPKNHNVTEENPDRRKLLMAQVKFLRDAMISHSSMLTQPTSPPSCVGDRKGVEVEDILCISRPAYLKQVKNPCWYERDVNTTGETAKLHCLPYFHILGCAKSGTTDLWMRLMSHPHIIGNHGAYHKEGLWWAWQRYGFSGYKRMKPVSFKSYVNLFREAARMIQTSLEHGKENHKLLITGDGSPPDFWDFRGWPKITQNRGLDSPRVITPHLMKHFYEDPKFILMFRDPIDRLYSDYFFIGSGLTSHDFHQDLLKSISLLANCVQQKSIQHCFYDQKLYLQLPVRIPFSCYSVFMREWLQIFPLENFFFIKTEEYEVNPEETLMSVISFLRMSPLRETMMQEIMEEERARVTFQKQIAGPMKPSTKAILTALLQPCSHMLARMIKQPKFVWDT